MQINSKIVGPGGKVCKGKVGPKEEYTNLKQDQKGSMQTDSKIVEPGGKVCK